MRRILISLVVLAVVVLNASTALAGKPVAPPTGGEPPGDDRVLPLSEEQIASVALKEALIARVPGRAPSGQQGLVIEDSGGPVAGIASMQVATASAPSHGYILYAMPRQQTKSYYCGPASVQVASNWSWRMGVGTNKYTQQTISDTWTKTDATLQTYLGDFITGMNGANVLPAGFIYAQKHNPTFINWHTTIVSGIYDWRMFLSAGVIPRKSGATYWLNTWNIVSNGGHYISLYGYLGLPEEAQRWVYYSDTAGTYAQSTAKNMQQGSYAVYMTMMYNNGNMVY